MYELASNVRPVVALLFAFVYLFTATKRCGSDEGPEFP